MMNVASLSNEGMEKVQGVLKKASIIETVFWIILGLLVGTLFLLFQTSTSVNVCIVIAITIVLGLISGITLFLAVEKDANVLFKVWFVASVLLIICFVACIILVAITLDDFEGWIEIIICIVLIPIKLYCVMLVWKYYKWNNRARGLGAVAAAVGLA